MPPFRNKRQIQLPDGFVPIQQILADGYGRGTMLNVIGVVTDFRTPVSTRGSDWKCEIRLYDYSVEDPSEEFLAVNVFRQADEMPDAGLGDVVVIFQAKLQFHTESVSLVTHRTTDIHIYTASQIPKPPDGASRALQPQSRKATRSPKKAEHDYVSILYHSIDKDKLPTESEFQDLKLKSANVTDKHKELKDVRDGVFADVIVKIVKQPYDMGDKFTLWVSDFTENDVFFNFAFKGIGGLGAQTADPFGYQTNHALMAVAEGEWEGPFGKRSMQVTCYEPHASFIRDRGLSIGCWVILRNLQIKYGHNAANLEGFLRQDRAAAGVRINIIPLDCTTTEPFYSRWKEVMRRERVYDREKRAQLKGISEAAMAGKKRKSDMADIGLPANSKTKSKRKRENKRAAAQAAWSEAQQVAVAGLNSQVKCEHENKAISSIEDILSPIHIQTTVNGEEVKLPIPFINAKYRANVRVVNFMPSQLEDFAHPKKSSKYDILSDDEDSSSESEQEMVTRTDLATVREWEWRFYLELEDATPAAGKEGKKQTLWAAVDNLSAQCLMDLDASDLRRDQENLEALRQRLFLLWGDLEEKKSREAAQKKRGGLEGKQDRPPLHSSDDESNNDNNNNRQRKQDQKSAEINNRPLACCIHQYGVKVPESDPCKADAGNGKRWQRMFGLFGTRIAYNS